MPVWDQPPQVAPSFALSEALQELQSTNAVLVRRFERMWQRALSEWLTVTEPTFRDFAAAGIQPFASFETEDDWTPTGAYATKGLQRGSSFTATS